MDAPIEQTRIPRGLENGFFYGTETGNQVGRLHKSTLHKHNDVA